MLSTILWLLIAILLLRWAMSLSSGRGRQGGKGPGATRAKRSEKKDSPYDPDEIIDARFREREPSSDDEDEQT